MGFKRKRQVPGLPPEVETLCEKRRQSRLEMLNAQDDDDIVQKYRRLNKKVKKAVKAHKNKTLDDKVVQIETDFANNNSHNLFKTVKEMENKQKK